MLGALLAHRRAFLLTFGMPIIGIPKERKIDEHRVAVNPDGVAELRAAGIEVLIETGAGAGSSFSDEEFRDAGASVADAATVWERADIVCKVKEPQADEFDLMREGQILFAYLHLAAYPGVADALLERGITAVAYETVQLANQSLPLLAPMSEIAGRISIQLGATYLERHNGGRGVLLGGVPGVQPARVVVLGAGNVGWNAASIAAGVQAEVHLLDKNLERLRYLDNINHGRVITLASNRGAVERAVAEADLVIGAVLVPGGRAPTVVTEDMVKQMKPGSVVVDIAIDQGGCIETSRETTHKDPVYEMHGVIHYAVGNIPGAVPNTSTRALTNATLPYLVELGRLGDRAVSNPALAAGINIHAGAVTNQAVAEALNKPYLPATEAFA